MAPRPLPSYLLSSGRWPLPGGQAAAFTSPVLAARVPFSSNTLPGSSSLRSPFSLQPGSASQFQTGSDWLWDTPLGAATCPTLALAHCTSSPPRLRPCLGSGCPVPGLAASSLSPVPGDPACLLHSGVPRLDPFLLSLPQLAHTLTTSLSTWPHLHFSASPSTLTCSPA